MENLQTENLEALPDGRTFVRLEAKAKRKEAVEREFQRLVKDGYEVRGWSNPWRLAKGPERRFNSSF